MLRVSPLVFQKILEHIKFHEVFANSLNTSQAAVEMQLAVTLYRMGQYGNEASIQDVACFAGCSEGSVLNFTEHCLTAIASLLPKFVQQLTLEEKEQEKQWIEENIGFGCT